MGSPTGYTSQGDGAPIVVGAGESLAHGEGAAREAGREPFSDQERQGRWGLSSGNERLRNAACRPYAANSFVSMAEQGDCWSTGSAQKCAPVLAEVSCRRRGGMKGREWHPSDNFWLSEVCPALTTGKKRVAEWAPCQVDRAGCRAPVYVSNDDVETDARFFCPLCQARRRVGDRAMVSVTKETALESRVQRKLPARFGGGYQEQGRDVPRRVPTLPQKHTAWLYWQQDHCFV